MGNAVSTHKRAALYRSQTRPGEQESTPVMAKVLLPTLASPLANSDLWEVVSPLSTSVASAVQDRRCYNSIIGLFRGWNKIRCKTLFVCSPGQGKARGGSHPQVLRCEMLSWTPEPSVSLRITASHPSRASNMWIFFFRKNSSSKRQGWF